MLLFFEVGGVHSPSSWLLLIHKYQIPKPQVTESHRVAPWDAVFPSWPCLPIYGMGLKIL